jgi:adenine-specific DNA-methyltransferase
VSPPDLFFTYMSHRYPRLITNAAKVPFVNSMHGLRLGAAAPAEARDALPLLAFNSVTMLGAEVYGRSYGGGILKMEPREAAMLPVPTFEALSRAWEVLKDEKSGLARRLQKGEWTHVVKVVDEALLIDTLKLTREQVAELHDGARNLRARRMGRDAD